VPKPTPFKLLLSDLVIAIAVNVRNNARTTPKKVKLCPPTWDRKSEAFVRRVWGLFASGEKRKSEEHLLAHVLLSE